MPDSQQTLRQVRCGHCGQIFFVCRRCDRGQVYCSADCRHQARRQSCRRANARHQASPEGRLDHRDRQRIYRMRRRARLASVTDQGSQATTAAFILPAPAPQTTVVVVCAAAGRSVDRGDSVSAGSTSQGSRHPDPGAARSRRDPPGSTGRAVTMPGHGQDVGAGRQVGGLSGYPACSTAQPGVPAQRAMMLFNSRLRIHEWNATRCPRSSSAGDRRTIGTISLELLSSRYALERLELGRPIQ